MTDASFSKIDYSIRPAKHAERKMLAEIFRRVRPFQPPEDYTYVGLGSVWFSDFILFHRIMGIKDMISIERAANAKVRIESNKPFRNIKMEFKNSSDVLPGLDWTQKYFLWLDYDDQLSLGMLLDVRAVAMRAKSGTLLAISVQCTKARELIEAEGVGEDNGYQRFVDRFGRDRVAQNVLEDDLVGWRFGKLSRSMLQAEIKDTLAKRNVDVTPIQKLKFRPICEFEYADGAKMTTVVGMFVSAADEVRFKNCGFNKLDFMPSSGQLVKIKMPILTIREMRQLERQLPKNSIGWTDLGAIPASQAKLFATYYRYLPNFAVVEP